MPRCFVAIALPPSLRQALTDYQRQLAQQLFDIRWSPAQNSHLTLAFLGESTEESLENRREVMLSVGLVSPPFALTLRGVGAFPSPQRAKVLWLGVTPSPALMRLQRRLVDGWKRAGCDDEPRPYRPHLTLGRTCHPQVLPTNLPPFYGEEFPVEEMILYESRLGPDGASHRPRLTVPLQGAVSSEP